MLKEELQLLQEPGSYVGEVVKVMGKSKVLVKVSFLVLEISYPCVVFILTCKGIFPFLPSNLDLLLVDMFEEVHDVIKYICTSSFGYVCCYLTQTQKI